MKIENIIQYAPRAVGLMKIENTIRYAPRAVGLKPSARQGEARLRGLYRIIYSKTIYFGHRVGHAIPRAECRPKFISVIARGTPFPGV